ncbi:solute carrier family 66 member 2-like isoform X2 [Artemia franciscana]|uniref:solute carrier family 66 member 2-like isoform X2 n=1 Tax=Artemia franciscana TaxID=6661 RepID=UPI0032DB4D1E
MARLLIMEAESDDASMRLAVHTFSLDSIMESFFVLCMVLGGVVPYVPQYLEIRKTENAEGFSLYVCLTLLVANVLRVLFWFGKRYEIPLLVQSIVMIIAMMAMIYLCVSIKKKTTILKTRERVFTDFDARFFWCWTDFQSYAECLLAFSLVCAFLLLLFSEETIFIEGIGLISLSIEALLAVPQFHRNFCTKSTFGMSRQMVIMWFCGDAFKTYYFISREAPYQFVICGVLQICMDLAILGQIFWYGSRWREKLKKGSEESQ